MGRDLLVRMVGAALCVVAISGLSSVLTRIAPLGRVPGGCANPNTRDRVGVGVAGGAIAAIAATAPGANDAWTVAAAGPGAAAGSLCARNRQTQQCACRSGGGETVRVGPCP